MANIPQFSSIIDRTLLYIAEIVDIVAFNPADKIMPFIVEVSTLVNAALIVVYTTI
jgi:hypothetical protein